MGTYGDALPPGVSVKENFNDLKTFKIYPNPVVIKLYFEFGSALARDLNLTICNTLGQIVYTKKMDDLNEGMDVSFLMAGIYFLKVERQGGQKVFRLVKE
ncbi:MAG: T9SS type A sorting domain-containing protein [Bacteroidia bacterium]|nr:T9SS type A sorting domain-containing protein [Bacteroidia bacterium]